MSRQTAAMLIVVLFGLLLSSAGLPFTPGARFSDAVTAHYPAALHIARAESIDDLLWQQTTFAGAPFAANPLNKTAYPLQWLARILDPVLHLNILIALHRGIAALGMMAWARGCGLSTQAVWLAGLAYLLSPRLIAHTGGGHLDVLYAMAWFPWLMEAVRRWAGHQDARHTLFVGLCAGLIVLSDVRVSAFALALAFAYGLWRARGAMLLRVGVSGVAAAACAVLISLPVIVPLLAWSPWLTRAGLTAAEANAFAMQPAQLVGMVIMPPSGNLETMPYVGVGVLLLAVFALVRAPRRMAFWIAACLLAGVWGLGEAGGVWSAATTLFPPLLWFRVPARAWLVIALIVPLLAGFGLDGLRALHRARPSRMLIVVGVGLFVAGLYVGLGLGFAASIAVGMVSGGIIALCCAVYGMRTAIGRILSPARLVNVIMVCVVVDLLAFMPLWMTWRPAEAWHTPAQRVLAERLIALNAGRVYSPDYALEQHTAALYGLHLFGGVDPFQIDGVARAIREAGGVQYDGYSVVQPPLIGVQGDAIEMANRDAVPDTDQLGAWGVTHIVARAPRTADGLTHIDMLEGLYVYAVDPQRVVAFGGRIPDWGAHDRLPPLDEVAALNRITVSWAGAGAAAFGAILLFIGFLGWRGHMRRAKIHGEGQ